MEIFNPGTCIQIDDNSIWWVLHAKEVILPKNKMPYGGDKLVQIEWGWSAGLSDEDTKNLADGAPDWKYAVQTTLTDAIQFHKELGSLIKEMKKEKK